MRRDSQRLDDIVVAARAIESYLGRTDLDDGIVFDAVRMRLIEIGEAVKALSPEVRSVAADAPWSDAARARDFAAHHYFDSSYSVILDTARYEVPVLCAAVERIIDEYF